MKGCRLGYFFARINGSDRITTVSCWGDKIEKDTKEDVEVLERVPPDVVRCCHHGVKILNLDRTIGKKRD